MKNTRTEIEYKIVYFLLGHAVLSMLNGPYLYTTIGERNTPFSLPIYVENNRFNGFFFTRRQKSGGDIVHSRLYSSVGRSSTAEHGATVAGAGQASQDGVE